jgi:SsrA-binding protein
MSKQNQTHDNTICRNKKAHFEYHLEQNYEAGIILEGWEVKSLRAGKGQIVDSYVLIKNNEAWLIGMLISPMNTASTHIHPDPTRTRKLLLHRNELAKLIGLTQQKGFTLIPLSVYWKNNRVKLQIAVAKGKQLHDKRASEKDRDWQREKQRLIKR